jgi:hypothetical protein
MARYIAVRASALITICGSLLASLLAVVVAAVFLVGGPRYMGPFPPEVVRIGGVAVSVAFAAFAAWGFWTATGIFARRDWARISIVVFSAMLLLFSAAGMVAMLVYPTPSDAAVNLEMAHRVRTWILGGYTLLMFISAWWLALFNTRKTREYFSKASSGSARPLSISVIAWLLIAGAASTALMAALRAPVVLFGLTLHGWHAPVVYTAFTIVQVYLGGWLLQLSETARLSAIVYFIFGAVNRAGTLFVLGGAGGITHLTGSLPPVLDELVNSPQGWLLAVPGVALTTVPIWFLVRRRGAFDRNAEA